MSRILTARQEAWRGEARQSLADLRVALARFGADAEAERTLGETVAQLDGFFLLVVVGEFNAGKSALVNTLVGADVLPEGVTPTTARITILRHRDASADPPPPAGTVLVEAGADLLRELHVVDTPGTNAIVREHEMLTSRFVPRADLVLFITSADRPFTESERVFLERIRDWGKKVVLVINKIDILEGDPQVDEIVGFVTDNARALLGVAPAVFPLSVRLERQGRRGDAAAAAASRFDAFERYLHDTLDETERVRLKLLSPIGVGLRLCNDRLTEIGTRVDLLAGDVALLEDVERQLALYAEDLRRGFEPRMADIEASLTGLERRGHDFFDETLRIGRVFDLLDKAKIQRQFEKDVIADTPREIERKANDLVDWLVDADFRQWQAVTRHLEARRREYEGRIIDGGRDTFLQDRARLVEDFGTSAERVVSTYDREHEAREIAEGARSAVAASAALEAGAAGLGAIVTLAATTAAGDVTGLAMAGVLAAVGFFVIPSKRRRAKDDMRQKVSAMRARLSGSLREEFARARDASLERIRSAVAPYSRFVRAERERLTVARAEFEGLRDRLAALKATVERE